MWTTILVPQEPANSFWPSKQNMEAYAMLGRDYAAT